jgi:hypothetical protein
MATDNTSVVPGWFMVISGGEASAFVEVAVRVTVPSLKVGAVAGVVAEIVGSGVTAMF